MSEQVINSRSLTNKTTFALGCGQIANFFFDKGVVILAIPFYQMTQGYDPFWLNICLSFSLLLSTFISPWVGNWVDDFKDKYGSRKPILYIPTIVCTLLYGFMWTIPQEWGQVLQFSVLFTAFFVYFSISNFITIPLTCLKFEATSHLSDRTRIFGILSFYSRGCNIAHNWIFPLTQWSVFGSTLVGVKVVGWGLAIFIALMILLPMMYIDETHEKKPTTSKNKYTFKKSLGLVLHNRPFLLLLLISFIVPAGIGYCASMDFYLIVYYMCNGDLTEGAVWKGYLSSAYAISAITFLPLLIYVVGRIGQYKTLRTVLIICIVGGFAKWFIYTPDVRWLLVLDAMLSCGIWIAMGVIVMAMIADVCDEEYEKTSEDHKGIYISIHNWVNQIARSVNLIMFGLTLNLIGFDANLAGEQTESTITSMRLILSVGTAFFCFIILLLLNKFPKAYKAR